MAPQRSQWAGLAIGLSFALAGIGMLAIQLQYVYKHCQLSINDLDLGTKEDYTICLQYTNDEIDGYPATTAKAILSWVQLSKVPVRPFGLVVAHQRGYGQMNM